MTEISSDVCSICLEHGPTRLTLCKHKFHPQCIYDWIVKRDGVQCLCPLCARVLVVNFATKDIKFIKLPLNLDIFNVSSCFAFSKALKVTTRTIACSSREEFPSLSEAMGKKKVEYYAEINEQEFTCVLRNTLFEIKPHMGVVFLGCDDSTRMKFHQFEHAMRSKLGIDHVTFIEPMQATISYKFASPQRGIANFVLALAVATNPIGVQHVQWRCVSIDVTTIYD